MTDPAPQRISTGHLVILSATGFLFLLCESKKVSMNDLGSYLAMGREMHEQGGYADVDRLTHTVAGTHFLNGTWGSQSLFYWIWKLGGYTPLQMMLVFAVTAAVLTITWAARRASGNLRTASIAGLLAAWLLIQNLGLRPQLFSLPFFAAYALLVMTVEPTIWVGIACAAIVAVWNNLHGAFAVAPVLSVLFAIGLAWELVPPETPILRIPLVALEKLLRAGAPRRHLFIAAGATAAALVNPVGWKVLTYVAENTTSPEARGLTEWKRTSLFAPGATHWWQLDPAGVRLVINFACFGVAMLARKKLPAKRDTPALLAFAFLASTAVRHVVWTGMIFPVALARLLGALKPAEPNPRLLKILTTTMGVFWIGALLLNSPLRLPRSHDPDPEKREAAEILTHFDAHTPGALVEWARLHGVEGNVFNPMEWGGLIAWRIPAVKLYVDVRIWIYPDDIWAEYLGISGALPGWEDALDRRQCRWVFLERRFHKMLIPVILKSDRWEKVYEDDDVVHLKTGETVRGHVTARDGDVTIEVDGATRQIDRKAYVNIDDSQGMIFHRIASKPAAVPAVSPLP